MVAILKNIIFFLCRDCRGIVEQNLTVRAMVVGSNRLSASRTRPKRLLYQFQNHTIHIEVQLIKVDKFKFADIILNGKSYKHIKKNIIKKKIYIYIIGIEICGCFSLFVL